MNPARLLLTALPLTALLAGCVPEKEEDTAAAGCVETYSADAGYEVDSDTISAVEAQCAAEGYDCADTIIVTADAAVCIAEEDGMAEGLDGYRSSLIYNHQYNKPIWSVSNLLVEEGAYTSGESIAIDAADGSILGRFGWDAQP